MKKRIRQFYLNTVLGYYTLYPVFRVYELMLGLIPDKPYIRYKFKKILGYPLDLENPTTFNQKISFLKLYDRSELHSIVADKFKVRPYVSEKLGPEYLVPLVLQTKDVREIVPENLPDYPFIIKVNHNSGGVIIVKNKQEINWKAVRSTLKRQLRENFYYFSREWQYKNIEPKIVVEKLLMDQNGNIPDDYKIHCFNGKLVFTQVDLERHTDHKRNLYDADWNLMPCKWIYENGKEVPKPSEYEKMKSLAELISKDFTYIRVDFYLVGKEIFFGELTFHAESGFGKFTPFSFDEELGSMLNIDEVLAQS